MSALAPAEMLAARRFCASAQTTATDAGAKPSQAGWERPVMEIDCTMRLRLTLLLLDVIADREVFKVLWLVIQSVFSHNKAAIFRGNGKWFL